MKKNELRRSISRKGVAQKAVFLIFFGLVLCAFAVPSYAAYFSFNAGCDNNLDGFGGGVVRNQSGVVLPVGSVLQYIYAGPDATIQPPNAVSGAVTGDDVLLGTTTVGDDNSWFGFSGTAGCFYNGYGATYTTAGPKIYVRAWNSSAIGSATYYGNSALFDPATDANNPPQPNDTGLATFSTGTTFVTPADITVCTPARYQGDTNTVVNVTGTNTHFTQGITTAQVSGAGVTVGTVEVTSTTAVKVYITSITTAASGNRDITLITTSEAATGEALFVISAPSLSAPVPASGYQGDTNLNIAVSGTGTHFINGTTTANFGANITVNSVTVTSVTAATVNITIAAGAATGARNFSMATNLGAPGTETVTRTNGFTVNAPSLGAPSPTSGYQGDTNKNITVSGTGTHFVNGTTTANFGANITVNSVTVTSATAATVNITISTGAATGARNFSMTTGTETVTNTGGFTVNAPSLSAPNPTSGYQGDTSLNIAVSGTGTHFINGTTTANFGANITVNSVTVTSVTAATVNITIAAGAASGARNFSMVTNLGAPGTETVTSTGGFTVNVPSFTSVAPTSGYQGDTITGVAIVGTGTHFSAGTTAVSFGSNVTVSNISIINATHLTCDILIAASAATGARNVVVTTGGETVTGTNVFTVNSPSFTSVTPTNGDQGATLTGVAIVGTGTHFGGTTAVDFGSNITVSNITITDAMHLTCNIVISASAATGARNVAVTTGSETVTGTGVFTVNATSPNSGGSHFYEKAGGIMMAYPNPFNPDDKANPLKMLFNAATGEAVDIYIFDTNGRVIYQNRNSDPLAADRTITWDGETSYGEVVDNGLYLIRIIKDGKLVAKAKILVIKK